MHTGEIGETLKTIYKNVSGGIVVIGDLNIKFSNPQKEKRGHTINLADYTSLEKIEASRDLKNAVSAGWLVATGPSVETKPTETKQTVITPKFKEKKKPNQPKMFFVRTTGLGKKENPQPNTIITYDDTNKIVHAVQPVKEFPGKKEETISSAKIETTVRDASIQMRVAKTEPEEKKPDAERKNSENTCAFMKNDGKQCRRKPQESSSLCYLHSQTI